MQTLTRPHCKNPATDFWKFADIDDLLSPQKLAALGISEDFLKSDDAYGPLIPNEAAMQELEETANAFSTAMANAWNTPRYCKYVMDKRGNITLFAQSYLEQALLISGTPSMFAKSGPHRSRRISRKLAQALLDQKAGEPREANTTLSPFYGEALEQKEQETQQG